MISSDPALAESITTLRGVMGACGFFSELTASQHRMDALFVQVEEGLSASARPFRIVLAGGTGVGKSTLLNALARSHIALVGETRPTTKEFTVYLHERECDSWAEGLEHSKVVRHHRDELKGKMIIDSPDADSALVENRRMLEEVVRAADLVMLVVTQEKYVSESLVRLVRQYRQGRPFAFVFNKADLCKSTAVLDDYRHVLEQLNLPVSRIYAISAKQADENANQRQDVTREEFRSLEAFVASELNQARIREIESENIRERVAELSSVVESALPEAWESAADRWREHCISNYSQFFAEIGTVISRRVLDREELAATITVARGSSLAGPFGLIAEVICALHRFRARGSGLASIDDIENWVRAKVGVKLSDTIDRREGMTQEACCFDGKEFGLDPQSLRDALRESMDGHELARGWCEEQLASHLREELKHHCRRPGLWINVLVNVLPWAWMLYWAYRLVAPLSSGEPAPWETIPGAAVVLLVLVFLQWSVVHRLLKLNARKRAAALASRVLSGVETAFLGSRVPMITRVADRIQACADQLRRALLSIESVTCISNDDSTSQPSVSSARLDLPEALSGPHGLSEGRHLS
jgi:small GTP-binding protein